MKILYNENTNRFGQYFIKEYASSHAMWSYAFRVGCGINTNMKLEAMHRVLKDLYMKGMKGKRYLDCNIYEDVSKEFIQKTYPAKNENNITNNGKRHSYSQIRERHSKRKSLENAENMCSLHDESFTVNSESNSTSKYSVTISEKDFCNCKLICPLQCLSPKYSCSCSENNISSQFCKHIHVVCIFVLQNKNNFNRLDSENDACNIIYLSQVSLLSGN